MSFFKGVEVPSCSNCKWACFYPAPFWYPFIDPYCQVHKVKCDVDKVCEDYEKIGRDSR